MSQREAMFGFRLTNIPLLNLRMEFNAVFRFVHSTDFEKSLGPVIKPIRSPMMMWRGMPADFLTMIVQRAILGIEAYLVGAVYVQAGLRGKLTKELVQKLQNPFRIKRGSGTVESFYDLLPSALDRKISLKVSHPGLWRQTVRFYAEIRNPLFHGKQISSVNPVPVRKAFDFLARLYEWIDDWHSPEDIMKGAASLSGIRSKVGPNSGLQGTPRRRAAHEGSR